MLHGELPCSQQVPAAAVRYPVYGFGAKIPPTHTFTTHCFALTGNFLDPEVEGVAGIVDIYRQVSAAESVRAPHRCDGEFCAECSA